MNFFTHLSTVPDGFWTSEHIWEAIGFIGQGLFTARFLVQWIATEKKKESVIPLMFWYFSISGGLVLLIYAIHIKSPVFILGQAMGLLIYSRNLSIIFKKHRQTIVEKAET
ncbi:MAG: lipid biosynthesis domain protein [Micavibrio sp.]|nr:lipid biosynthesis domain protein [Micavibrio sp.]